MSLPPFLSRPRAYQAGQGGVLQGGPLVRQVGQQLSVPLGGTAGEGLTVGFPYLPQAAGRWGTVGRAGPARGPLGWPRCPWGAGVPRTQRKHAQSAGCWEGLGVEGAGHSLVEEQQVRWVQRKVTLEAMQGGQVGQAAELGRANDASFPRQPLPLCHVTLPLWDQDPCVRPHVHPVPSAQLPALCHLDLMSSSACLNLHIRMASYGSNPA